MSHEQRHERWHLEGREVLRDCRSSKIVGRCSGSIHDGRLMAAAPQLRDLVEEFVEAIEASPVKSEFLAIMMRSRECLARIDEKEEVPR